MSNVDIEERKLQYLNRSAAATSEEEQKALDKEYPDVIRHMLGDQPAKKPVFSPEGGGIETVQDAVAHFGAAALIEAALPIIGMDELSAILNRVQPGQDAAGRGGDGSASGSPSAQPQTGRLPADWRKLHWTKKVKLANDLGGNVADVTGADTWLELVEQEDTAAVAKTANANPGANA